MTIIIRKTSKYRWFSALVLFMPVFFSSIVIAEERQNFEIKFGLLEPYSTGFRIKEETYRIPFRTRADGQYFGFVVFPADNLRHYVVYSVTKAPSELNADPEKLDSSMRVYRSAETSTKGDFAFAMWLDEGDPLGEYVTQVYIDGVLVKQVEFVVGK